MIDINYANIPGAICLLVACSILYDRLVVQPIETRDPPLGVTAWEVVGGVLYTMIVTGFVIGFEASMLGLLLFGAAGIPMILGSHNRHTVRVG